MDLDERIESFVILGKILRTALNDRSATYGEELHAVINNQQKLNPWFTPENVKAAVKAIADELTEENLTIWTSAYPELREKNDPVKAGVIMAGNIPLVGFHDFLSVLISGNNIITKTSSKDSELIVYISNILCSVNKAFSRRIEFTDGTLTNFDVVIATGSNNSSRYFEYYFGKYPNVIRKNRNSISIIEGVETETELESLGKDIFLYFGLGCRNVSKIFIPKGYEFASMTKNWNRFSGIINHNKYANNYIFNKAVNIVNKDNFYDTGYLILKEDSRISSPVSVLHYEYYESQNAVIQQIKRLKDKIQCVVGRQHIPFGKSQYPNLWDYSDGIDTIEFLIKKK
jgi:hypothetical protein